MGRHWDLIMFKNQPEKLIALFKYYRLLILIFLSLLVHNVQIQVFSDPVLR